MKRIRAFYRRFKVLVNLNEWRMRLLGLKVPEEPKTRHGLLLIQIDGLSYPDLQNAMAKGHMPFLSRLEQREHYHLWPLYSGVPSNTPAFQGEFFFGVPQCIPSFQHRDKATGEIFTMFDKNGAGEVEKRLLQKDEGLIAGGSAYASIFAGGAAESHICASTADWGNSLKAWNPYSLLITLVLNPYAILRGAVLCVTEGVLALLDFFRGLLKGQDIYQEWMFIFMRVMSSILIREITTNHAQMDIYRGLPVVFVNYFGYDEQAHRRGPSARFAYWSLSGIDAAAKKLWRSALRARRRHYDVWIYSDHGQEKTVPFSKVAGRHIRAAVKETYDETHPPQTCPGPECPPSYGPGYWGDTVSSRRGPTGEKKIKDPALPFTSTFGPISQIYFPTPFTDEEKKAFAKRLIEKYPMLPLVVVPLSDGKVDYETKGGTYHLPQDAEKILGADHPYLEEVAKDLGSLLQHESRGDLVMFGWSTGMPAISFSNENGAHAGLGPRETQAFALLPTDAPVEKTPGNWIRPSELRQAALVVLGRAKLKRKSRLAQHEKAHEKLRVMSYNVHSCTGIDGILSVERIARIIAKADPDVVALQELDVGRKVKGVDQAAAIARELEMHFHFHSVCGSELQCFGNAILSRYPMKVIRAEHLPRLGKSEFLESRGVLWVEIDFFGKNVHIVNTHLSIWGPELKIQLQKLLSTDVLGNKELGKNVILCGDFNTTPGSKFYRLLMSHFKEPSFPKNSGRLAHNTWISTWPIRRLDHILMKGSLEGKMIALPRTRLECRGSDHLPIAVDFEFKGEL